MNEPDVERAVVKTYVPAYQKDAWIEHADRLDMSQSEFVRTMVQAGRRDFAVDGFPEAADDTAAADREGTASSDAPEDDADDARGEFEDRVYALLREETRSWDDLLEAVTDDVEGRLEDALQSLQASNKVVYSGRNGGYEAVEE
ncbi:DUF5805 domain-containing protein [Halorubellus litoreus]|uniref:DUF5805 domain-containing protein n=1 Tax=Halorubellus litoreus TaxID=755308 RepID=A0ABD5VDU6_9EURY